MKATVLAYNIETGKTVNALYDALTQQELFRVINTLYGYAGTLSQSHRVLSIQFINPNLEEPPLDYPIP